MLAERSMLRGRGAEVRGKGFFVGEPLRFESAYLDFEVKDALTSDSRLLSPVML
jgi:hypothetical protein